jgi:hypothetical protein
MATFFLSFTVFKAKAKMSDSKKIIFEAKQTNILDRKKIIFEAKQTHWIGSKLFSKRSEDVYIL